MERMLHRATAATGLIAVAGICWAITAHRMSGMDMGPGTDLGGLGWFAVVWVTMMAALFALGVMNVTWMIVVAALVAIEKLLPWERVAVGATAVVILVLGLAVAIAPDQVPGLTIPG